MEQAAVQGRALAQRSRVPAPWQAADAKPRRWPLCQSARISGSDLLTTSSVQPSQQPWRAGAKAQRQQGGPRGRQQWEQQRQWQRRVGVRPSRSRAQIWTATRMQMSWRRVPTASSAASWKRCARACRLLCSVQHTPSRQPSHLRNCQAAASVGAQQILVNWHNTKQGPPVLFCIRSQVLAPQAQAARDPESHGAGKAGKTGAKSVPESGVVAVVEVAPVQKGKKKGTKTRRGKKGGATAAPAAAGTASDLAAPEPGPAAAAPLLTGASVALLLQSERGIAAAQDIGAGGAAGTPRCTPELLSSTASAPPQGAGREWATFATVP
jgi:hypothetical protein